MGFNGSLVTTDWLADNLANDDIKVVDATHFRPHLKRNAHQEYLRKHISGAVFFDMDTIRDTDSPLPIMLPDAKRFSYYVGGLGLRNQDTIILYDSEGFSSLAARAWWMFRVFGHRNVAVLDGGLKTWIKEGRPVVDNIFTTPVTKFSVEFHPEYLYTLEQMRRAVASGNVQIIDTRSAEHFNGAPSPLAPRHGHMPGAVNLPASGLVQQGSGKLASRKTLEVCLKAINFAPERPAVVTCGGAGSAPVLALALYSLGLQEVPVYDGAWAEWGSQPDTPVEANHEG